MNRDVLQARLRIALRELLIDEWSLFESWASGRPAAERAVCAQLAAYLRPLVPRQWDVDCEYNRAGLDAVKHDPIGNQRPPDLIVHHRGEARPEANLLFVELKVTGLSEGTGGSAETVRQMVDHLKYQDGVFLTLDAEQLSEGVAVSPSWWWYATGEDPSVKLRPVFSKRTLDVVLNEARAAGSARRAAQRKLGRPIEQRRPTS